MSYFPRMFRAASPLFKTPLRFKSTEAEVISAPPAKASSNNPFSPFLPNDPGVAFLMAVGLGAIGWLKSDIMGIRSEMVQVRTEMAQDRIKTDEGLTAIRFEMAQNVSAIRLEMTQDRAQTAAGFAEINQRFDSINDRFDKMNDRFDRFYGVLMAQQEAKKPPEKPESGGRAFGC